MNRIEEFLKRVGDPVDERPDDKNVEGAYESGQNIDGERIDQVQVPDQKTSPIKLMASVFLSTG